LVENSLLNQLENFQYTLQSSVLLLLSHLAVKGKNDLSSKDTIIIGSLCNEQEQVLLRESCSKYFKKFEKLVKEKSNSTNNKQQIDIISECRTGFDEYYIKICNSMITEILMETNINQSIGRNQGFRSKGGKTVVVLPVLHSKHHHVIPSPINLIIL
jgi:hypothetical protein